MNLENNTLNSKGFANEIPGTETEKGSGERYICSADFS
jgi:hypothetical protein